ncbi:FAST kinase domain-containing protein 4 [Eumeta japonica]|uniref:FAST kinase domain-containing protein 4 n=1 Tax=Eumeta variegata TaxID=151549 RepID=A0A4C1U5K2_EUMVA|nr:FAST kinase domain-containing protein 4 [Eumeta japonica]
MGKDTNLGKGSMISDEHSGTTVSIRSVASKANETRHSKFWVEFANSGMSAQTVKTAHFVLTHGAGLAYMRITALKTFTLSFSMPISAAVVALDCWMFKYSGILIWRLGTRPTGIVRRLSSPSASVLKTDKLDVTTNAEKPSKEEEDLKILKSSGLVAAAFASLNSPDIPSEGNKTSPKSVKLSKFQQIDIQIAKANDLNSLLVFAESAIVSRRHALKIVSILSEWITSNKVALSDFEKDPRFLKLCRILARTPSAEAISSLTRAEDLSTVLGITGDDEAARLIGNLTLSQMIKVMKALSQKGRRSTPLLRALAHNITRQSDVLDLKKSADLLFSMSALNFPDPLLLDRICRDILDQLPSNTDRPAVVTSIMVSLGLLRYRDESVMDAIVQWLNAHSQICRAQDVASCVITLGTLDYKSMDSDKLFEIALSLKEQDLVKSSTWLDLVFSLLILQKATQSQLTSTLTSDFIDKLLCSGEIPIPLRRKLIAIEAYLCLTVPQYSGPRLPDEMGSDVPIVYTKEKQLYIQSIMDTFKSLVSSENFLKKNCNSGMGFLYDGEFAMDVKCYPVPLDKAVGDKSVYRIAIMGLDYHDLCRKQLQPLGVNQLYTRLLELKGYKVLQIPYTEYNPRDKLISRVQYIEKKIKEILATATASAHSDH